MAQQIGRFMVMLAGTQMCAFSARLVSEGHMLCMVGISVGTALVIFGGMLPVLFPPKNNQGGSSV